MLSFISFSYIFSLKSLCNVRGQFTHSVVVLISFVFVFKLAQAQKQINTDSSDIQGAIHANITVNLQITSTSCMCCISCTNTHRQDTTL